MSEIVQVERAAQQVLAGPEREELAEDLAVHDHAANYRHQHRHGGETDDPVTEVVPGQVQAEMHRVEKARAERQPIPRQHAAIARIDRHVAENEVVWQRGVRHFEADEHGEHRIAMRGERAPGPGRQLRGQWLLHAPGGQLALVRIGLGHLAKTRREDVVERGHWLRGDARLRQAPAIDLAIEHRHRAEEEGDHQDEAEHQAKPGVQPRHR